MRRRQRRSWLSLCLAVVLCLSACATVRVGKPPPCPQWDEAALLELERLIDSESYPALEYALGRQELHCEALD